MARSSVISKIFHSIFLHGMKAFCSIAQTLYHYFYFEAWCSITEINGNGLENETLTSSDLKYHILQKPKLLAFHFRKINWEIYRNLKYTHVSLKLRRAFPENELPF